MDADFVKLKDMLRFFTICDNLRNLRTKNTCSRSLPHASAVDRIVLVAASKSQPARVDAFLLGPAPVEEHGKRQQDRRNRRQQNGTELIEVLHAADLRRQHALTRLD